MSKIKIAKNICLAGMLIGVFGAGYFIGLKAGILLWVK